MTFHADALRRGRKRLAECGRCSPAEQDVSTALGPAPASVALRRRSYGGALGPGVSKAVLSPARRMSRISSPTTPLLHSKQLVAAPQCHRRCYWFQGLPEEWL